MPEACVVCSQRCALKRTFAPPNKNEFQVDMTSPNLLWKLNCDRCSSVRLGPGSSPEGGALRPPPRSLKLLHLFARGFKFCEFVIHRRRFSSFHAGPSGGSAISILQHFDVLDVG